MVPPLLLQLTSGHAWSEADYDFNRKTNHRECSPMLHTSCCEFKALRLSPRGSILNTLQTKDSSPLHGNRLPGEAIVKQTMHRRDESRIFLFTICFCGIQSGRWAVVDVWAVSRSDWSFLIKEELWAISYTCCSNTRPDLQPVVICRIAIEVSTVPIHTWNCPHCNFRIDVLTLCSFCPSINLDDYALRKIDVHNVFGFATSSFLQENAHIVIRH